MAISRMQMKRQLYAGGGIMELAPRSKFGLGSKLKKFVRKVIPNEISEIAVKAAPFVAPFNPLLAGAMSGIGSFDQTGSISSGLKRGLLTYGGGQAARYLGGAGFQQGINPFAGADFSGGIMSGIKSLGTSPFGTETGLKLGQYEMFGGPGKETFQAQQEATKVAMPQDLDSYGSIEEYLQATGQTEKIPLQLRTEMVAKDLATKAAPTDYGQLFKTVASPESTFGERTEAIKQLGGKALKNIYTDDKGKIDKLAVASTIAGASSYLDAKRLAKEADLVGDENEYTEEMYEADKARYTEKYAEILPASAFGLKKGGRVGYQEGGTDTVINADDLDLFQEGSPKYYSPEGEEISFQEFEEAMKEPIMPRRKPEEMVERNKLEKLLRLRDNMEPEAFEMYLEKLKEESGDSGIPSIMLKKKMAIGGRVGFFEGTDDPQGRRKGIVSINPMQEDLEEVGIGTLASSPFTAAEKTFLFKFLAGKGGKERTMTMPDLYKIFKNPGKYPKDEQVLKGVIEMKMGKKEGGRIGYAGGSSYEGMLEDSFFNDPDYIEMDKGIRSILSKLESASKKDKFISAKDYNDIVSKIDYTENPAEKLSDKILYKINPYPKTERDVERIAEVQRMEKKLQEEQDRMDYFDSKYLSQPGVRKDAEKILNSKEFKKWKEDSLSGDPKRKAKASANPKDDYFRAIYSELNDKDYLKEFYGIDVEKKAYGGRIGYMMGSEVPVRENQAGVREMDFRNTGGFVPPIGVKEKADDIPAMLSNNEFVFTADAVRAAGGGSVNKGAQKMYALMKQLEGKLV